MTVQHIETWRQLNRQTERAYRAPQLPAGHAHSRRSWLLVSSELIYRLCMLKRLFADQTLASPRNDRRRVFHIMHRETVRQADQRQTETLTSDVPIKMLAQCVSGCWVRCTVKSVISHYTTKQQLSVYVKMLNYSLLNTHHSPRLLVSAEGARSPPPSLRLTPDHATVSNDVIENSRSDTPLLT